MFCESLSSDYRSRNINCLWQLSQQPWGAQVGHKSFSCLNVLEHLKINLSASLHPRLPTRLLLKGRVTWKSMRIAAAPAAQCIGARLDTFSPNPHELHKDGGALGNLQRTRFIGSCGAFCSQVCLNPNLHSFGWTIFGLQSTYTWHSKGSEYLCVDGCHNIPIFSFLLHYVQVV